MISPAWTPADSHTPGVSVFVVSVAQLVELWIVAPAAGGSNPLAHPTTSSSPVYPCTLIGAHPGSGAKFKSRPVLPALKHLPVTRSPVIFLLSAAEWPFDGPGPCHCVCAPVAQLDRASDFESAGRPFESGRVRHLSPLIFSAFPYALPIFFSAEKTLCRSMQRNAGYAEAK